jgi:outer membrane protein assembly factor BamB
LWSKNLGATLSRPVAAGGKVFATTPINEPLIYPYRQGTRLWALDLRTGAKLWSRYVPSPQVFSFVAADAKRVFVLTSNGELRAFDASTGAHFWTVRTGGNGGVSPTVDGGKVYACIHGVPHISGSNLPVLVAFRAADGRVVWRRNVGGCTAPTVSGLQVFVAPSCEAHGYDARTGSILWNRWFGCTGGGGKDSVFYSDRLFTLDVDNFNEIIAFNLDGRAVKKRRQIVHPPAFSDGIGYWSSASAVRAISLTSDQVLWSFSAAGRPAIPPIVVNDKVLVASATGSNINTRDLFVLDAQSGQTLQTLTLDGGNVPHYVPAPTGFAAGEGVVVVAFGGALIAFGGAP